MEGCAVGWFMIITLREIPLSRSQFGRRSSGEGINLFLYSSLPLMFPTHNPYYWANNWTRKIVQNSGKGWSTLKKNDSSLWGWQGWKGNGGRDEGMSKFARSSKNCEKLDKSQFLLKLIKSSVTGRTRVPSKNCDFTKNCEKLEKSQFFLLRANLDISACMGTLHPRPIKTGCTMVRNILQGKKVNQIYF